MQFRGRATFLLLRGQGKNLLSMKWPGSDLCYVCPSVCIHNQMFFKVLLKSYFAIYVEEMSQAKWLHSVKPKELSSC